MSKVTNILTSGIWCRFFHYKKGTMLGFQFTDKVSGDPVFQYKCEKCKITFMANNWSNIFRVHVNVKNQNEQKEIN
jgi:hypothetical protein